MILKDKEPQSKGVKEDPRGYSRVNFPKMLAKKADKEQLHNLTSIL